MNIKNRMLAAGALLMMVCSSGIAKQWTLRECIDYALTNNIQLKQNLISAATAEENERAVVDMETLQYTNEQLIATIDEVLRIQTEGQSRSREAEGQLLKIENELKQKLIEAGAGRKE